MNGLVDEWIYTEMEGCREEWLGKGVDEWLCTGMGK